MRSNDAQGLAPEEPWYLAAFGQDYLTVYSHRNEADARRAVECAITALELSEPTRTLDLCCGAGRHAAIFTQHHVPVVGLDLSAALLSSARGGGIGAPLVRADMLCLPFADQSFDRVVNFFSSFGYFHDDDLNRSVLREVARVLKPAGRALFDLMNPAFVEANLVPESEEERQGVRVQARRRIVGSPQRVEKAVTLTFGDGRTLEYVESVRLYQPEEFDAMLAAAGLKAERRFGDFDDEDFGETSQRQIVIAAKS